MLSLYMRVWRCHHDLFLAESRPHSIVQIQGTENEPSSLADPGSGSETTIEELLYSMYYQFNKGTLIILAGFPKYKDWRTFTGSLKPLWHSARF